MGDFRRLVGEQIRAIRKSRGLTQTQLAERTGNDNMSKSRISDIENGKINISLDTLERLMNALNVTPGEFFNFQKFVNADDYHEKRLLVDLHRQVLLERDLNEVKYVIRTTKDFLDTIDGGKKPLFVLHETNMAVVKSAANIPGAEVLHVDSINVYDLLNHDRLIATPEAVRKLEEVFGQ